MKAYSIFDDFSNKAIERLREAGIDVIVHPSGRPRPDHDQMKSILEDFDCVIIGTSQKISEDMFDNITAERIIATASVGLDHIKIPDNKKQLITVLNISKANAQSVAEYTIGCALACVKRLAEGNSLYKAGKDNKQLYRKPNDLSGKTIGIVGAGSISVKIMEYARFFRMNILCWTKHPDRHKELPEKGIKFVSLENLIKTSDIISVNLPNNSETKGIISADLISKMKEDAVFISVSRLETVNLSALFKKARDQKSFYVCLDIDVNSKAAEQIPEQYNLIVTPHIAGGTVEARERMFLELADRIVSYI